mmetsp:Transcript_18643/g.46818  ORF Transcript_18643/g.46818 Transcript_18643/m.46818 type:complete len:247 (+) Transcript_18643:1304-2044(+)
MTASTSLAAKYTCPRCFNASGWLIGLSGTTQPNLPFQDMILPVIRDGKTIIRDCSAKFGSALFFSTVISPSTSATPSESSGLGNGLPSANSAAPAPSGLAPPSSGLPLSSSPPSMVCTLGLAELPTGKTPRLLGACSGIAPGNGLLAKPCPWSMPFVFFGSSMGASSSPRMRTWFEVGALAAVGASLAGDGSKPRMSRPGSSPWTSPPGGGTFAAAASWSLPQTSSNDIPNMSEAAARSPEGPSMG